MIAMSRTQSYISTDTIELAEDDTPLLFMSVVVPVRNEEEFIGRTLTGLLQQDYPAEAFEIIVVDGDSTDGTRRVIELFVSQHSNVQLRSNPRKWSSAARNVGIAAALGDVVIIVDGHCQFLDDQYLRNVETAFRRNNVDCLGRPQPLDVTDSNPLQQAIAIARASRLGHHPDSFIYSEQEQTVPAHSVAVAYRKSVFEIVGMFDEDFDACEDVEFNHRVDKAGLTCLLAPSIQLRYYPRSSLSRLFRQMARYGRGRVRLLNKHADTFSLKSLVPALFLFFLLAGALVTLWVPLFRLAYLGVVAFYVSVIFGFSIARAAKEKKVRLVWLLPMIFATVHFGAGYGSLQELIFGKPKIAV